MRKGFSLIEIVIALIMIVVITLAVGIGYFAYVRQAKIQSVETFVASVYQVDSNFFSDTGRWSPDWRCLVENSCNYDGWNGPYLTGLNLINNHLIKYQGVDLTYYIGSIYAYCLNWQKSKYFRNVPIIIAKGIVDKAPQVDGLCVAVNLRNKETYFIFPQ